MTTKDKIIEKRIERFLFETKFGKALTISVLLFIFAWAMAFAVSNIP